MRAGSRVFTVLMELMVMLLVLLTALAVCVQVNGRMQQAETQSREQSVAAGIAQDAVECYKGEAAQGVNSPSWEKRYDADGKEDAEGVYRVELAAGAQDGYVAHGAMRVYKGETEIYILDFAWQVR